MFNEIEKHCAVLCSGKSICFITESTSFGGTKIHTLSLMKALIERGHRITLIACRHHEYDDRIVAAGLNGKIRMVHSTFKMNDFGIRAFYGWKKLLNEVGGDVVERPKGWNLPWKSRRCTCCADAYSSKCLSSSRSSRSRRMN